MRCPNCGKESPANARFCGFCGAMIASPEEMSTQRKQTKKRTSPIAWLLIIALLVSAGVIIHLMTKETDLASKLPGSWYNEGSGRLQFTLYSDGTFETKYDEGQWSVVNGKILKLMSAAESDSATIVSVRGGCLTLSNGSNSIRLWNSAQKAINAG